MLGNIQRMAIEPIIQKFVEATDSTIIYRCSLFTSKDTPTIRF
jgi:hypothetical protein